MLGGNQRLLADNPRPLADCMNREWFWCRFKIPLTASGECLRPVPTVEDQSRLVTTTADNFLIGDQVASVGDQDASVGDHISDRSQIVLKRVVVSCRRPVVSSSMTGALGLDLVGVRFG